MKKLYLILLFSMFFAFSLAAQPLSYDSFTKKYKEAAQLYYQKRYESALQILDILAADDYAQTYPSVFLSRSLVLYYMGRYDEAYCLSALYIETALMSFDDKYGFERI